jgi:hypothetical protein
MSKENTSLSKSEVKSLGCEYYYRKYYVEKVPQHPMPWTKAGTQFHNFMDAYIKHCVASDVCDDLAWALDALAASDVCDDARELISRYVAGFKLDDPREVLGAECFFVVDQFFQPIPEVAYPGVGKRPAIPGAFAHGTLDVIERTGPTSIRIRDFKTGFMPSRVDPYEAIHYAILAFAHFPWAMEVTFIWDFIRFGSTQEAVHHRESWPELIEALLRHVARRAAMSAKTGAADCDSLAGLCGYCALDCPTRKMAMDGHTIFKPIQNDDDARDAAQVLSSFRAAKSTLEAQLRFYLDGRGEVDLGMGKTARMNVTHTPVLALRTVLAALGIELPETSPEWDVPLDKLVVNNTEFGRYAKAKKRTGLHETIQASVPTKARTVLKIGDEEEPE